MTQSTVFRKKKIKEKFPLTFYWTVVPEVQWRQKGTTEQTENNKHSPQITTKPPAEIKANYCQAFLSSLTRHSCHKDTSQETVMYQRTVLCHLPHQSHSSSKSFKSKTQKAPRSCTPRHKLEDTAEIIPKLSVCTSLSSHSLPSQYNFLLWLKVTESVWGTLKTMC